MKFEVLPGDGNDPIPDLLGRAQTFRQPTDVDRFPNDHLAFAEIDFGKQGKCVAQARSQPGVLIPKNDHHTAQGALPISKPRFINPRSNNVC